MALPATLRRFGAAILISFCAVTTQLSAQTAAPTMSVAERKATLEQGLQQWLAARYQDALAAFIKAGNGGERRAAGWAAIALEEGIGTHVQPDVAAQWHLIAATGFLDRNVPAEVERLGDGAIRYHVKPYHLRATMRADGSWTRELLHERILLKDGAQALEGQELAEYVIDEDAAGNVIVTDWRGGWWSLDAPAPEDRLTREPKSGDLTFTDDLKRVVTLRWNGRRTIATDSGPVRRLEMDAGGRMVGIYNAEGKATNQFQHDYRGAAEPLMSRFINDKGALWGVTPLEGGRQRWTLLNGDNPSRPVTMDAVIRIDRANSLVTQDGGTRVIDTRDGTRVREVRRRESGDLWVTEKTIGTRNEAAVPAYTLVTHERGEFFKQEFKAGDGQLVRDGSEVGFRAASWWAVDKAGKRKPGTAQAVDIFIDDDGTLITRRYASEPDPARPGDIRVRRDARGNAIVEDVSYRFTSGETEQHLGHGGIIRRDSAGDVLWTRTPGGEFTRFYYRGEGDTKIIIAMREGANPRWTYDEKSKAYVSRQNYSFANVSVNRRSGDVELEDDDGKVRTTYRVDGSRRYVTGSEGWRREIDVDPLGRIVRFVTPSCPEFKLYYASDGRLERVDHAFDQGFSIVEPNYQAPPGLPLTAKQVFRGTALEFLGWGDDRYVSFLDAAGHRINVGGGATLEEHGGEASAPLIRVTLRSHFTIIRRGHEKPAERTSILAVLAEAIHSVSGAGWNGSVTYSDAQGRRLQRFARQALSEFDSAGRLVRHADERGRVFEFGHSSAKPGVLESVVTPDRRLRRNALSGGVVDFQLTTSGDLLLMLESGFELYDFPDGRRTTIGADGTLSFYDHLNRLSHSWDLKAKSTHLFYEAEATTPARREELAGIDTPREGTATIDIALDRGRLRTLERTVTERDGRTTKTVIARLEGGQWIDEERNVYARAWIGQLPRRVFLASGDGRFMRVVDEDGSETRLGFDAGFGQYSRVLRNAWGEVTAVAHKDRGITHFERNDKGKITVVLKAPDTLVLGRSEGRETFNPSVSRARLSAGLVVGSRGDQVWTGSNGIERIVAADGTVEVKRPDGSRSVYSPDGATRHVLSGRPATAIAEVTEFASGDIEWVLADGTVRRHAAHGTLIELLKGDRTPELDARGRPKRVRGQAAVGSQGDLAILDLDRPALVVHHADGSVTQFERAGGGGWRDPSTGEVFSAAPDEIRRRLLAMGAPTLGLSSWHRDFTRTEPATRSQLFLGLFEFESPTLRPARSAARRQVSFVTRQRPERSIAAVMLAADGKPQVSFAVIQRPQPVLIPPVVPPPGPPARPSDATTNVKQPIPPAATLPKDSPSAPVGPNNPRQSR